MNEFSDARKAQRRAWERARYAANKEKFVAKAAAWRAANPEKVKSIQAKYDASSPSKIRMAKWRRNNPEKAKELNRKDCAKRRAIDPDKANRAAMESRAKRRASDREWARTVGRAEHAKRRAEHPDKVRAEAMRYRAALKQCTVHYTAAEIALLRREKGNVCAACLTMDSGTKSGLMTIDHIVPLSRVGTLISEDKANSISNIQLLCLSCNCKKRTIEWNMFLERSGV
jgi:5-methylcytosine-specific restriction endonuclease McrA